MSNNEHITLSARENQARGLAEYALSFMKTPLSAIDPLVLERVELFNRDALACGISALAVGTNAPTLLRREALGQYSTSKGACCLGSRILVHAEKAVLANAAAVREWDSNGTLFGYNPKSGHAKGEFGHNDYYGVPVAAAQVMGQDGRQVLLGMLLTDEIRGRLAEVYSLKDKKIDHVVHGALASLLCYGAMLGATAAQLESALGLFCSHYIPYRSIRAGEQLSDSKGASAAISTEVAMICVHRAMMGFTGPSDIFRNPEALWCLYEKHPSGASPFDLTLTKCGSDFAVMGMHFKMGLYEHQSASAVHGIIEHLQNQPRLCSSINDIEKIDITIYNPAYHIICDKAKWNPDTRQSADHSLPYIVASILKKATQTGASDWKQLMLLPDDYSQQALRDPLTRSLMQKVHILHGGKTYDEKYPEGIPTSLNITHKALGLIKGPMVMFPLGHARNTTGSLQDVLIHKMKLLIALAKTDQKIFFEKTSNLAKKSAAEVMGMTDFHIQGLD